MYTNPSIFGGIFLASQRGMADISGDNTVLSDLDFSSMHTENTEELLAEDESILIDDSQSVPLEVPHFDEDLGLPKKEEESTKEEPIIPMVKEEPIVPMVKEERQVSYIAPTSNQSGVTATRETPKGVKPISLDRDSPFVKVKHTGPEISKRARELKRDGPVHEMLYQKGIQSLSEKKEEEKRREAERLKPSPQRLETSTKARRTRREGNVYDNLYSDSRRREDRLKEKVRQYEMAEKPTKPKVSPYANKNVPRRNVFESLYDDAVRRNNKGK